MEEDEEWEQPETQTHWFTSDQIVLIMKQSDEVTQMFCFTTAESRKHRFLQAFPQSALFLHLVLPS